MKVDNYRLLLGADEYVPIMIGGMGVNISTAELALEACRLGGIGHISDAMVLYVSDKKFNTHFSRDKAEQYRESQKSSDKSQVKFDVEHIYRAQRNHVEDTMNRKQGSGGVFINIMEKLTMGAPKETLSARIHGALDGGIDGITLSAGLHTGSVACMAEHPRFRDVKLGIIVSSARALKIFLRSALRYERLPDYIVVEGPLAGGHLGFGEDWKKYNLQTITAEVLEYLKESDLNIPVIPAGGVFTGSDAVEYIENGASAVQVATRFTVTEECGLPEKVKQKYFEAKEENIVVNTVSPTGYPIRMLTTSPCLTQKVRPQCEAFGYTLSKGGKCPYVDHFYQIGGEPTKETICLCYHFSRYGCYTCGHYAYRLKDTSSQGADGLYQILTAEHVFKDYQFSVDHEISRLVA